MSRRDWFATDLMGIVDVAMHATGAGTSGDPWVGWDTDITWSGGQIYYFRPGYFQYTSTWATAGPGLILQGSGCAPGETIGTIITGKDLTNDTNGLEIKHRRVWVRDLLFVMDGNTGGSGILVASGTGAGLINVGMENVYLYSDRGATANGIKVGASGGEWVTVSRFTNVQSGGTCGTSFFLYAVGASEFHQCYSEGASAAGWLIESSTVKLNNCYAESPTGTATWGFDLLNSTYCELEQCTAEYMGNAAFRVRGTSVGNTFRHPAAIGCNVGADATADFGSLLTFVDDGTNYKYGNIIELPLDVSADAATVQGIYLGQRTIRTLLVGHDTSMNPLGVGYYSTNERINTVDLGGVAGLGAPWTDHTFDASNYTNGGGTSWTVGSGDVVTHRYQLTGTRLTIDIFLSGTQVSGTPSELRVALPLSLEIYKTVSVPATLDDAGTVAIGLLSAAAGATYVSFQKTSGTFTDTGGDHTTGVYGHISLEVV